MSYLKHYSRIELDKFIVMPNHVHGIIWILEGEGRLDDVGLSEIVRGFKTFSARKINDIKVNLEKFAWHRGFYEHIIRDEVDLENHRRYIVDNPLKWSLDEYYSA